MIKINDPTGANFLEEALKNGSEHKDITIIPAVEIANDGGPMILVSYKTYAALERAFGAKVEAAIKTEPKSE